MRPDGAGYGHVPEVLHLLVPAPQLVDLVFVHSVTGGR